MKKEVKSIETMLKKAHYSKRYKGYQELVTCIELIMEDENRLCDLVQVYKEIGRVYDVSWNSVEKNIRKVNESAWKRGGKEFIDSISGMEHLVVPRTGELLEVYFDYLNGNC